MSNLKKDISDVMTELQKLKKKVKLIEKFMIIESITNENLYKFYCEDKKFFFEFLEQYHDNFYLNDGVDTYIYFYYNLQFYVKKNIKREKNNEVDYIEQFYQSYDGEYIEDSQHKQSLLGYIVSFGDYEGVDFLLNRLPIESIDVNYSSEKLSPLLICCRNGVLYPNNENFKKIANLLSNDSRMDRCKSMENFSSWDKEFLESNFIRRSDRQLNKKRKITSFN